MRGKLRDKRADVKRYPLKREQMGRRFDKREVRNAILLKQQWDEEEYLLEDDKELVVAADEMKN